MVDAAAGTRIDRRVGTGGEREHERESCGKPNFMGSSVSAVRTWTQIVRARFPWTSAVPSSSGLEALDQQIESELELLVGVAFGEVRRYRNERFELFRGGPTPGPRGPSGAPRRIRPRSSRAPSSRTPGCSRRTHGTLARCRGRRGPRRGGAGARTPSGASSPPCAPGLVASAKRRITADAPSAGDATRGPLRQFSAQSSTDRGTRSPP